LIEEGGNELELSRYGVGFFLDFFGLVGREGRKEGRQAEV
jgi:hypothetical protein